MQRFATSLAAKAQRHAAQAKFLPALTSLHGSNGGQPVRGMAKKSKKAVVDPSAGEQMSSVLVQTTSRTSYLLMLHLFCTGKTAALSMALKQIESSFGKGSIMKLGDKVNADGVDVISTGSLSVDLALGIGGLPKGRVVEIYGPESSGKTTLALHVVAQAQKAGLSACFIDVEHALDPLYANALGVNLDDLFLSQPDAGEQALEIADTLVRSQAMDVVVVDSVAALVPRAEVEGDMGDHHMALQARLMSQALRKLNASLSRSSTLLIFINQIRSKVGVMFGSPEVTAGGNALKFYASIRMDIRRTGQIKNGTEIVGNTTRVKVVKNKLAPPFRQAEFDMTYGYGISRTGEIVDLGAAYGVLKKGGAWYSLPSALLQFAAAHVDEEEEGSDSDEEEGGTAAAAAAAQAEDGARVPDTDAKQAPPATDADAPPAVFDWSLVGEDAEWEPFAQGKEKAKAWLEMHPEAADAIDARVRALIKQERAAGLAKGTVGAAVAGVGTAGTAPVAEDISAVAGGITEEDDF